MVLVKLDGCMDRNESGFLSHPIKIQHQVYQEQYKTQHVKFDRRENRKGLPEQGPNNKGINNII